MRVLSSLPVGTDFIPSRAGANVTPLVDVVSSPPCRCGFPPLLLVPRKLASDF